MIIVDIQTFINILNKLYKEVVAAAAAEKSDRNETKLEQWQV